MKIKVLGTRGEIEPSAPYHAKKSGVLIDDTILLDVGDESFLEYKPECILITHLHPDHAYFVRYGQTPEIKAPIYAPEPYKNMPIKLSQKLTRFEGYTIKAIPTIHSVKVKSNAYLIEHNKKRILYTGDMIWIEKKYHKLLTNLDLVITEGSFIKTGGIIRRNKETGQIFGHTGIPNLIHFLSQCTKRMLFVHFGAWFYKDMEKSRAMIQKLCKENNVEGIIGYDGLEFEI